ncbi:hypothetical protein DAETH_10940 [Deinococcus aetherius]|uniref:Uncharacterized protein n=1 Tax=Deinococcus aetherius TaxID=200252 RepID=A0ABN6RCM7_9DEIO|nr:hypothetical protein [Deinococcus aetherius]BDP41125.1 hypothetical protein DAETH_10940 [Deinococcus aetherius]
MSVKDNFTPDEWFKVMTGPGRAGAAVVAASPSGVTGLVAEAQAIGAAIREQVSGAGRTPLLEAMAADLMGTPPDPRELPRQERARSMEEARAQSVDAVRQAVWLVSSKATPEDAASYRRLLWTVAQRTAEAAREGGFLGIGGEQVSEGERAALSELRSVLGMDDDAAVRQTPPNVNPGGL